MTHSTEPSAASPIEIEPSTKMIFSVRLNPSASLTNTSDHFTGYTPLGQSVGTVYVSVISFELSAATEPLPVVDLNI